MFLLDKVPSCPYIEFGDKIHNFLQNNWVPLCLWNVGFEAVVDRLIPRIGDPQANVAFGKSNCNFFLLVNHLLEDLLRDHSIAPSF